MKPNANSLLQTLHPSRQLQVFEWLNTSSQEETARRIEAEFGFKASPASLTRFYAWYPSRQRLMAAKDFLSDLKDYVATNPDTDLDSDQISKAAQLIYEKRAIEAEDPKLHIELRRLRLKEQEQTISIKRMQDKVDAGLEALYAEIKGNSEAVKLFDRMRALLKREGVAK